MNTGDKIKIAVKNTRRQPVELFLKDKVYILPPLETVFFTYGEIDSPQLKMLKARRFIRVRPLAEPDKKPVKASIKKTVTVINEASIKAKKTSLKKSDKEKEE